MIEGIESILALEKTGTVSEAAVLLRVTQSALSKRIQVLQDELGYKVIEPDGRRVRITAAGLAMLEKARPLVAELRGLKHLKSPNVNMSLTVAIADSIATSWGPDLLGRVRKKHPSLSLTPHVHRTTLLLESLRLGRYQIGLCVGPYGGSDLVAETIGKEPMVLLANNLKNKIDPKEKIITIEQDSATWKAIGHGIASHSRLRSCQFTHVESFAAAVQMVRAGFGNGLVPLGIAKAMGIKPRQLIGITPSLTRDIVFVTRKSLYSLSQIAALRETFARMFHV